MVRRVIPVIPLQKVFGLSTVSYITSKVFVAFKGFKKLHLYTR